MYRLLSAAVGLLLGAGVAIASPGPTTPAAAKPIPVAQDRPFPGVLHVAVDATDIDRRILRVHETLSGLGGDVVLFYPQWLPGNHAPTGPIDRLVGLTVSADGAPVAWQRDTVNLYAFRLRVPAGARAVDLAFEYVSPTTEGVGALEISRDNLILTWNTVLLYPAGYYTRQIPVEAALTLPPGWSYGTALEPATAAGPTTTFRRVDVETLVDSPLYAGRHAATFDLDPGGPAQVLLHVFADRPEHLAVSPAQLDAHRRLVREARALFGSRHYAHYDFLYSLSKDVQQKGLEHQQSSENGANPTLFTEWDANAQDRDLLAHEYTHSWNGKFRRPADLWTPTYNVPMQNSLLWVYEGQTEYWGDVLAARAGLRTPAQALDNWAQLAAFYDRQSGRRWRALQDTTNDSIMNYHRPQSWRNYQRYQDYYGEGALIWLDVDTLIRERSGNTRSLDDFARAFFGIDDGSRVTVTYTFDDIVHGLNAVVPYDWAAFLRARLDARGGPAPLDGLRRGGYRLEYTTVESDYQKAIDAENESVDLLSSIGVTLTTKEGRVTDVVWDSPAFNAHLFEGSEVLAINGTPFTAEVLKDAITAAAGSHAPIELICRRRDQFFVSQIHYDGGLRYPHLVRTGTGEALLDRILGPRAP